MNISLPLCGAIAVSALAMPIAHAQSCRAESGATVPVVVELYTSEGCNSCPPADRWLSSLKHKPDVLAAAFHVDYWDRLGWKDRFASARHTERQARQQAAAGARFSYTPQVLVNGRDWRRWPELPAPQSAPGRPKPAAPPRGDASEASKEATHSDAPVRLTMQRLGEQIELQVRPLQDTRGRWTLWWAVLEDGHVSDVKAGENSGVRLQHDHVVRQHGEIAPFNGELTRHIDAPSRGEGGRVPRVLVVVTDAASGATAQALQLRCAN
jgi:hypothetical protein